jgi:hypothetical protein
MYNQCNYINEELSTLGGSSTLYYNPETDLFSHTEI